MAEASNFFHTFCELAGQYSRALNSYRVKGCSVGSTADHQARIKESTQQQQELEESQKKRVFYKTQGY